MQFEFLAVITLSSVSRDPSEIILICWFSAYQTFIIIINTENIDRFFWNLWFVQFGVVDIIFDHDGLGMTELFCDVLWRSHLHSLRVIASN